jgi:hypothetical protein
VNGQSLPRHVEQLIAERIDSVAQLEIVLLLMADPTKPWSAGTLAKHMAFDQKMAQAQLDELCTKHLLGCDDRRVEFRYAPSTPELDQAMRDLGQAYADRRVTVIGMIFSKPTDKLRNFADAFRIRRD